MASNNACETCNASFPRDIPRRRTTRWHVDGLVPRGRCRVPKMHPPLHPRAVHRISGLCVGWLRSNPPHVLLVHPHHTVAAHGAAPALTPPRPQRREPGVAQVADESQGAGSSRRAVVVDPGFHHLPAWLGNDAFVIGFRIVFTNCRDRPYIVNSPLPLAGETWRMTL